MGVLEALEVLYSPVKALKKIVEKPDVKGVVLVLVLVIFSMVVVEYVAASKFFLETRTPEDENWTESETFWASNSDLLLDDADYKVGNYSVKSSVANGTSVWMKITDVGPFDCMEDAGYKELFFWIKWIHGDGSFPSAGATLRLFSGSESNYFELDLSGLIPTSSGEWNNATVPLGPESQGWSTINSDWENIMGLEFRLAWLTSTNLTMKIDGLYLRKYVSPLESGAFGGAIIPVLMSAAVSFSMNWILWAGILLMIAKVFREDVGPWTGFFVIIGHVFVASAVYTLVSALSLSTLPVLNLPLDTADFNLLIHEAWSPFLAYQLWLYIPLVGEVWIAMLCAVTIRVLRGVPWGKATSLAVVAFVIRFVLRFFFGV